MAYLLLENRAPLLLESRAPLALQSAPPAAPEYFPIAGTSTFAVQGLAGQSDDPNIVSFKLNAIATRKIGNVSYQVCGYRSYTRNLVLGVRTLSSTGQGPWTLYHYNGENKVVNVGTFDDDSHNVVAVEIDVDGYVHVSYDMHNYTGHPAPLKYQRSTTPLSQWAGALTGRISMLGTANETTATYPMFFRDPTNGKLYFTYRNGVSGNGDTYFYRWNDATRAWEASPGTSTNGLLIQGSAGAVGNAYLNGQPKFSSDWDGAGAGFMHFNWMWRMDEPPGGVESNQDIMYAKWNSATFFTYGGAAQTVPITIANADRVHAVGPSVNLFNQIDFDLDSNDRPVIGLIHNDGGGKSQLYALYHNGSAWVKVAITAYTTSAMTDFGRPLVVIDKTTNIAYFIGSHLIASPNAILKWASATANYGSWTQSTFYALTGVAQYEPQYDRYTWLKTGLLDMIVSRIYIPDTPTDVLEVIAPVT